ncbi:hypothetical protein F3Y22_tig00110683pilonHSYRG00145 [Hibiscus syriacus]|uniref:Uncharacterized protein n=1 Tax=Hibiscus syriacus TaxID=106335 RepID=A0A6A2ZWN4_HIBSY|nr:hypothetical protein F3Y22_tig00110683pilonHSYRG00145 [Hibiscus syriacus]
MIVYVRSQGLELKKERSVVLGSLELKKRKGRGRFMSVWRFYSVFLASDMIFGDKLNGLGYLVLNFGFLTTARGGQSGGSMSIYN